MATIISDEELEELRSKRQPSAVGNASIISNEELESTRRKSPAEKNATATIGDYIRAVPATAVDITAVQRRELPLLSGSSLGIMA